MMITPPENDMNGRINLVYDDNRLDEAVIIFTTTTEINKYFKSHLKPHQFQDVASCLLASSLSILNFAATDSHIPAVKVLSKTIDCVASSSPSTTVLYYLFFFQIIIVSTQVIATRNKDSAKPGLVISSKHSASIRNEFLEPQDHI